MFFKSGTHNVELATMAAQNLSCEEEIISIAPIPTYIVYNGFDQEISAALVYKRLRDIQHDSLMQYHALALLRSCMVGICRNKDTKTFPPHGKLYKCYHLRLVCGHNGGPNRS